jgi:D-alanyl-D-alanine carboxypeptidase
MKVLPSLLALLFAAAAPLAQAFTPAPPKLDAKSYALMDYASGDFLATDNADEHLAPASMTKIMTAYIVFGELQKGRIHLDDKVLISRKAWMPQNTVSKMFIEVGTRVSVGNLLQGLIVPSGNDAAVALAEYVAGSTSVFVQLMNQTAQHMGLKDTHFANVDGLPVADHYSSAHDLCILARHLIQRFPKLYRLFSEKSFTYNKITQPNTNELLFQDPTVDGVKTGFTDDAGYCLLASARRDGRRLISVVMGTPSERARASDNEALLNYGYRFFETDRLLGAGSPAANAPVYKGATAQVPVGTLNPVFLGLPSGSHSRLGMTTQLRSPLLAPIAVGTPVGTAQITLDGKPLRKVDLVALKADPEGGLWRRAIDSLRLWMHR